jgi:hypothetical protein
MAKDKGPCECSYPGCPAHKGQSECPNRASVTVRRLDMGDGQTGFAFCEACADDALDSGVFDAPDWDV